MKKIFLLFILSFAILTAQAQEEKQEWVVKGAQVFNKSKVEAKQPVKAETPMINLKEENLSLKSTFAITEAAEYMNLGTNNALSINLEGVNAKLAKKVWTNYLKSNYGISIKKVKKADDYIADDVTLPLITTGNTMDMYSRTEDRGTSSKMIMWVDLGGKYLSSEEFPSFYSAASDMLKEYKLEVQREVQRQEIKAEEKELNKLQTKLKSLKRKNSKYHKIIEISERKIQKAKSDIEKNVMDQANATQQIESQVKEVEKANIKLARIK
ncbi:MAG: hypothetical protein AAFO07_14830 [Bacteroidota bacterium]